PTFAGRRSPSCASRAARAVQRGGLITEHGADMRLPDLLATLANCENARAFSIYDRCKAWYVHRPGGVQRVMARLQSPIRLIAGASPVV
ncbi:MAG TPA: hypothetical protein VFE60_04080, partial [Roseiarcus sp.]|nr:hypothetical protein [Roseiarcus sp.]